MPMVKMPSIPERELSPWASSLCFTGHRPEKLPTGAALDALLQTLYYYIDNAVKIGFTHFYTGLADGVDYYAADYLFHLREQNPAITVIGMQPCRDYRDFFQNRGYSLRHLDEMLDNVDQLVVLPGTYSERGIFLKRNCSMVDRCSGIIAVCADGRSGSMQTYRYAVKNGLAYCRILPTVPEPPFPEPAAWPAELYGM